MTLYVLSGPQTNRIGLYQFSFGAASEDLEAGAPMLRKRLERVCATFGWHFDRDPSVIWIPSWWNFNGPSENGNNMQGALSDLAEVPDTPLILHFAQHLVDVPASLHRLFTAVADRYQVGHRSNTVPHTVRTQEKEQEQEKETEQESSSAVAEPAALTFPTVGLDGDVWSLTHRQISEWSQAYPSLDILAEARKALAWLQANPGRRKTSKGMPKFLVGWLSRTTDRGRSAPAAESSGRTAMLSDATKGFLGS